MRKILSIGFLILSGCCHSVKSANYSEIRGDMSGLNKRLRGYYYNNINKDLSTLTKEKYLTLSSEQQDPSEKEYFEFLKSQKPEIAFRTSKTDFVVCIKTISVVICDVASTALTDFDSEDSAINLNEKIEGIPLK